MTTDFSKVQIKSNVPIPSVKFFRTGLVQLLKRMDVGDSFETTKVPWALYKSASDMGIRVVIRDLDSCYGIWRIE